MRILHNGVYRDMDAYEYENLMNNPVDIPTDSEKSEAYDIIVSGINSKETPKPLEIAKKIKELVEKYYKEG